MGQEQSQPNYTTRIQSIPCPTPNVIQPRNDVLGIILVLKQTGKLNERFPCISRAMNHFNHKHRSGKVDDRCADNAWISDYGPGDHGICVACSKVIHKSNSCSHNVISTNTGLLNSMSNVVTLCLKCKQQAGNSCPIHITVWEAVLSAREKCHKASHKKHRCRAEGKELNGSCAYWYKQG